MANFFPPNLEDGELWLPSEIIDEITSTNATPKHKTIHHPSVPFFPEPKSLAARPLPYVIPKIDNGFFGNKPNLNNVIGARVPYVDRSPYATSFGGFKVVPGTMNINNLNTQIQNQGFKKRGVEKSVGTGVFLPHTASYFKEPKQIGSRDFLHH